MDQDTLLDILLTEYFLHKFYHHLYTLVDQSLGHFYSSPEEELVELQQYFHCH